MPAKFKSHACYDLAPPLCTETAFLYFSAFAGIHALQFDSTYSGNASGWVLDGTTTLNTSTADQITVIPPSTPANTWFKAVQSRVVPHSHTLTFDVLTYGWAVVLGMQSSGAHWLVASGSAGVLEIFKWAAGATAYTSVLSRSSAWAFPQKAQVQIAFREIGQTDADEIYHNISLYANNKHYLAYTELAEDGLIAGDIQFGLAAKTSTSIQYLNVRVPELSGVLDWLSVDPGESGIGGLQRAIEGQHMKFFMRFDGTLRAWKPKEVAAAKTYTKEDDFITYALADNSQEIKTHIRLTGGYTQAEVHREDLTRKYGHRFGEVNNSYILTVSECRDQADLAIKRMEENAEIESFVAPYSPLLEPEDRIVTPTSDRIVTQRGVSMNGPEMVDSVTARTYVYGA